MTAIRSHFTPDQHRGRRRATTCTSTSRASSRPRTRRTASRIDMYNINRQPRARQARERHVHGRHAGRLPDVLHRVLLGAAPRDGGLLPRQAEAQVVPLGDLGGRTRQEGTTMTEATKTRREDGHVHLAIVDKGAAARKPAWDWARGPVLARGSHGRRLLRGLVLRAVVEVLPSTRLSTRRGSRSSSRSPGWAATSRRSICSTTTSG